MKIKTNIWMVFAFFKQSNRSFNQVNRVLFLPCDLSTSGEGAAFMDVPIAEPDAETGDQLATELSGKYNTSQWQTRYV